MRGTCAGAGADAQRRDRIEKKVPCAERDGAQVPADEAEGCVHKVILPIQYRVGNLGSFLHSPVMWYHDRNCKNHHIKVHNLASTRH